MLLAGDVGGTKTVLALFREENAAQFDHKPIVEATFASRDFQSLESVVAEFVRDVPYEISSACFGVAGPVVKQRAEPTNLAWTIEASAVANSLGKPVYLLNDLEAIANAAPHLGPDELFVLNEGQPEPEGALAIIAPGTGLGEAFLVWTGDAYESYPSEGGHAAFAPTTQRQIALLSYWAERLGHVSCERFCSGVGIPNIYRYLLDEGEQDEPPWLEAALAEANDKTPLIVSAAVEKRASICEMTLDLFMEILGGEAANLALKVLATGGVFVGGGIAPRILSELRDSRFMDAFQYKGRLSEITANIPVHVIRNPKIGLYGAAYEALRNLEREQT